MKEFLKRYTIGLLVVALIIQPYFVGHALLFLDDAPWYVVWFGTAFLEFILFVVLAIPYAIGEAIRNRNRLS